MQPIRASGLTGAKAKHYYETRSESLRVRLSSLQDVYDERITPSMLAVDSETRAMVKAHWESSSFQELARSSEVALIVAQHIGIGRGRRPDAEYR